MGRIAGGFGPHSEAAPPPDPETLQRLRGLGYVGIAAPSGGGRGPDPKDVASKVDAYQDGISRAIDALNRGDADAAINDLKRLLADNDRSYELHLFLGDAYAARRQYDQALGEYAAAGVLEPDECRPHPGGGPGVPCTGRLRTRRDENR